MRNANTTFSYRWFQEVWNKGRRDAIDELLSPDVIAHGLSPDGHLQGIESFKTFYDGFKKQLDHIHVTIDDVVSQDDMETSRATITARHIESGKMVIFSGICQCRFVDGKIAEAWNHYDFLKMWEQLGMKLTPR